MTNNSGFIAPGHSKLRGFLSYPGSQKLSRRLVVPTWLAWAPKVPQGFFVILWWTNQRTNIQLFGSWGIFWDVFLFVFADNMLWCYIYTYVEQFKTKTGELASSRRRKTAIFVILTSKPTRNPRGPPLVLTNSPENGGGILPRGKKSGDEKDRT